MFIKFILICAAAAVLSACASKKVEQQISCGQVDWYELGRRDGAQGVPVERLEERRKTCQKETFAAEWETVYTNGRNAGLIEYCSIENGYELGRQGLAYFYVCPSTMEPEFLTGYRRGQTAHTLEVEIKKLDSRIDTMVQQLVATNSTYERNQLTSELEQLKKMRARNDQKLTQISK